MQGSNPIYNLLPDILSSLSAEPDLPSTDFQVNSPTAYGLLSVSASVATGVLDACKHQFCVLVLVFPDSVHCQPPPDESDPVGTLLP